MAQIRYCFIFVLLICGIQSIQAEETDQFTLPPEELIDIGPTTSRRIFEVLEQIIAQTNSEIQMLVPKAKHSNYAAKQLAKRRDPTYIADIFYKKTGPGFPRWLRRDWMYWIHLSTPVQYKEKRPWKTIYWLVFSQSPLFVIGLAPTIHMYDYYFGTDKLGHFFMQGHTYYTLYMYYLHHGKSPEQAHAAMVLYGQILEQTYLGTLINGVYSNADLSGNYAGWKFYMNIGHSVKIGTQILPPILVLNGNTWEMSKHIKKDELLRPYLSDNLNEAFNPCHYLFMQTRIRSLVKDRCGEWIEKEGLTLKTAEEKLKESSLWHGEKYGHWLPTNEAVTLKACFGER